jgi:hypothetical protein
VFIVGYLPVCIDTKQFQALKALLSQRPDTKQHAITGISACLRLTSAWRYRRADVFMLSELFLVFIAALLTVALGSVIGREFSDSGVAHAASSVVSAMLSIDARLVVGHTSLRSNFLCMTMTRRRFGANFVSALRLSYRTRLSLSAGSNQNRIYRDNTPDYIRLETVHIRQEGSSAKEHRGMYEIERKAQNCCL